MKINTVSLGDDNLEISYAEDHEASSQAMMMRLLVVRRSVAPDEIREIEDLLKEVVDAGLLSIRNPPQAFGGESEGS